VKESARSGIFFGGIVTVIVAAAAIVPVDMLFLAGTTPDQDEGNAQNQNYRKNLLPIHVVNITAIAKLANDILRRKFGFKRSSLQGKVRGGGPPAGK